MRSPEKSLYYKKQPPADISLFLFSSLTFLPPHAGGVFFALTKVFYFVTMSDMKESIGNELGIVFSTDLGRMCPKCAKSISDCICSHNSEGPLGDGRVRISRETKGRKGKGVTVISGLLLDAKELQKLAKKLKRKCGAGGTVKGSNIEIQGEHRDFLIKELQTMGYKAKRAGG